jgi:hypothetical protein
MAIQGGNAGDKPGDAEVSIVHRNNGFYFRMMAMNVKHF